MFKQEVADGFAENLRRCRKRSGLSQEKLGYRASLHRTEIGLLERGARIPQLDTILKVAGGLSVSPCELLDGMIWRPGSFSPGEFDLNGHSNRVTAENDEHPPDGHV
ncbi:MAG TPA: helix-turn-helix transcriptional regulator [Solirubrobacterales bacterium]|nr:helix-turn-helix transcriptional regulator [Solirubrobacterales bacterium]